LTVLIIGGRLQREGERSGPLELEELLREGLEKEGYSIRQTRVKFYPWWAEWDDVVRRLHFQKTRYRREPFGIVVCAFSRGVGYGVVQLCKRLPDYDMKINSGVFSDGIYHHWWGHLTNWRSMFGGYQIYLPDNTIYEWDGFYQRRDGMQIEANGGNRLSWTQLNIVHTEMDDAPLWHDKCLEVVLRRAKEFCPRKDSAPKTNTMQPLEKLESKLVHDVGESEEVIGPND
jgi:hypothetical protein